MCMLSKQCRLKLLMYSTKNVTCGITHISIYYFTHLGLFALQISSYCVQNTLFVDKQQQNGDSTTSSYDQKLKMSKVSLTTLQAVIMYKILNMHNWLFELVTWQMISGMDKVGNNCRNTSDDGG